jgi:hypothetical protein
MSPPARSCPLKLSAEPLAGVHEFGGPGGFLAFEANAVEHVQEAHG